MNEQMNAAKRDLDQLMHQMKGYPPRRMAVAVWEWMRAQGFGQAHTPSDDEREVLAEADALIDSWDRKGSWSSDSPVGMVMRLASALRRTAVQEPSTDDRPICAACGVPFHLLQHDEGCDVPEPQGEPTDAQVIAALDAYWGVTNADPYGSRDGMRAALRAAADAGQEEQR